MCAENYNLKLISATIKYSSRECSHRASDTKKMRQPVFFLTQLPVCNYCEFFHQAPRAVIDVIVMLNAYTCRQPVPTSNLLVRSYSAFNLTVACLPEQYVILTCAILTVSSISQNCCIFYEQQYMLEHVSDHFFF